VAASGLRKSYNGFEAVRGVDFQVYRGECFGFLGPNGAGKTTTMKMLYGAAVPSAGRLTVAGLDVTRAERQVKRRIGVVPQENNLDDDLRVRENLLVYGRYYDLPRSVAMRRADELLNFVELGARAEARVNQLSGGMKRRLLIARALINDPQIVILDEPTTGLDPQARLLVWERLRELVREGKTLILTTHYMEEAAQLCDRLVIMESGKIVTEGSPDALVEEHVSPQVLEFRADSENMEVLRNVLAGTADSIDESGGTLFAYTADSDGLMRKVRDSEVEVENTTFRKAGLEDVFLRLTGRRLVD
jgi:lipooligosaccharide transport system ATP-binding protein